MTRTSSFSGLFETFGTVGGGYARNMKSGDSILWNAITNLANQDGCANQALTAGIMMRLMLNYETPEAVYYKEISFSLLDQLNGKQ